MSFRRPCVPKRDPCRLLAPCHSIAASQRRSTRQNQFDNGVVGLTGQGANLRANLVEVARLDTESGTSKLQTLEMQGQKARPPTTTGNGLEQAVAKMHRPIKGRELLIGNAVQQYPFQPRGGLRDTA